MNERRVIDVSGLPTTVFGHRGPVWWGTLGFMVVEGTTLAAVLVAYYYLRRNFAAYPPPPTALPDLLLPTIALVVVLAAILPMRVASARALDLDAAGCRRWLGVTLVLTAAAIALRALEFEAVNARWDEHAYGSVVWTLLGFHLTLLVVDLLESGALAAIFARGKWEEKHFTDVQDAALYQYFLSLSWLPVYVTIYLGPRFL